MYFGPVRTVQRQNVYEINTFSFEHLVRREQVVALSLEHSLIMLLVADKSFLYFEKSGHL